MMFPFYSPTGRSGVWPDPLFKRPEASVSSFELQCTSYTSKWFSAFRTFDDLLHLGEAGVTSVVGIRHGYNVLSSS